MESLKYYSAMAGLKVFNAVCSAVDMYSYFFGMVYSSVYSILTGMENTWCFYDGADLPVQKRFTDSARTESVEWFYFRRTREWVHRTAITGKAAKKCPWMTATLVKPNGDMVDLSEFFAGHRFYMPYGYIKWPTAEQMLAAWSIESHQWFIGDNAEKTMMTVMDMGCDEHSFSVGLRDDDSLRAYWRTFGMTYSADSSAAPSEGGSEDEEEAVAEVEEVEPDVSEEEESTDKPVVETAEDLTVSDTEEDEDAVVLPEPAEEEVERNPLEEMD